jgi:hypothetical protein
VPGKPYCPHLESTKAIQTDGDWTTHFELIVETGNTLHNCGLWQKCMCLNFSQAKQI